MEERNSRKVKIGKVISNKMDKTIVVAIEENKSIRFMVRSLKRTYKLKAHDEENVCSIGDKVKGYGNKTSIKGQEMETR